MNFLNKIKDKIKGEIMTAVQGTVHALVHLPDNTTYARAIHGNPIYEDMLFIYSDREVVFSDYKKNDEMMILPHKLGGRAIKIKSTDSDNGTQFYKNILKIFRDKSAYEFQEIKITDLSADERAQLVKRSKKEMSKSASSTPASSTSTTPASSASTSPASSATTSPTTSPHSSYKEESEETKEMK
jgi:hypothetical protein